MTEIFMKDLYIEGVDNWESCAQKAFNIRHDLTEKGELFELVLLKEDFIGEPRLALIRHSYKPVQLADRVVFRDATNSSLISDVKGDVVLKSRYPD